ncbi:MAG: hypothetical protein Hals2KO_27090 [Halioglobus sp.]
MLKPLFLWSCLCFAALGTCGALAQEESEHYEDALQAYAVGEYNEAYIHLKNALQIDPGLVPARILLAKVHFNAGDTEGAAKEAEQALEMGADLNLVLSLYGTCLILQGRADDLLALEKRADSLSGESQFEWLLLKGQAYLIRGDSEAARREFEKAAELYPDDARSNNTLAAIYLQSGMFYEAAARIEQSLLLDADNVKTLELKADLAMAEGRLRDAQASLDRAYALDPADLRVLRGLARVHLLQNNQTELAEYLALILEESPQDPAATLLSAISEISAGDAELGDAMLGELSLKLAELDGLAPQSSDGTLFIQASADYLRKSDRQAINLLNKYLRRKPGDLLAIKMLSDLYVRNGENDRARELLGDSPEVVSRDLGLSILLLQLYMEGGRELSARELLSTLRKTMPDQTLVAVLEAELNRSVGKSADALALLPQREASEVPLYYSLLRGALLLDVNRVDEAQTLAAELQRANPDNLKVQNFASVAYLRGGQLDAANNSIEAALRLDPNNVDANFNQAMTLKRRGELEEAAVLLNRVLITRPDHIRSIMLMANILHEQDRSDEAIDWSKTVYAYDKTSLLPEEFQLRVYTQTENWPEALKTSRQLIRADPVNEGYLVKQVEICIAMGDYDSAQRALRGLFSLWEKNPAKLRQLAAQQVRTENLPEARLSLETALELEPDAYSTRLELARLDIIEENFEAARKNLAALEEEFGPRSATAYALGEISLANDDNTSAQKNFMRAFELDRTNGAAVVRLYELSQQGIGSDAFLQALETTLKEQSLPPWVVRIMADSYLNRGDLKKAARYYEALLSHPEHGNDPGVLNNLANIYAEQDLDKALETAMRALEAEQSNSPAVLDTVGWILVQQEEHEQALPYLRKAYTLNSRNPEIRYHTAMALIGLKREQEAAKELSAALKSRDEFPSREAAQRLLESLTVDN